MGSTNFTPNYSLPQFIGTDKPAWLTDVNGAFSAIDTAIKNAADDATAASNAASTASGVATGAANTANTLNIQINTPSTGIAAVVSQHTTDLTGIDNKIGAVILPTTAQTLTGAIDEIYNEIGTATLKTTAAEVKSAINEVYDLATQADVVELVPEASETYAAFLGRLYAATDTNKLTDRSKLITITSAGERQIHSIQTNGTAIDFSRIFVSGTSMLVSNLSLSAATYKVMTLASPSAITYNDYSSGTISAVKGILIY